MERFVVPEPTKTMLAAIPVEAVLGGGLELSTPNTKETFAMSTPGSMDIETVSFALSTKPDLVAAILVANFWSREYKRSNLPLVSVVA
ncbi:MAG TPA: hypothetical protein VI704_04010, partial [Bacteroidota bacterium]|nr:hypothetical protein [Bacteroidota bacterium]